MNDAVRTCLHVALSLVSPEAVERLRDALVYSDAPLIQWHTTRPDAHKYPPDWPTEACCVLAFLACGGEPLGKPIGEVDLAFADFCLGIDQYLLDAVPCNYWASRVLLEYLDCTPWDVVRRELLLEVGAWLAKAVA